MKRLVYGMVWVLVLILLPGKGIGQVSNLLVNGMATNAQATQGEVISWRYDLSVGGMAHLEIWVDVDSNAVLQPSPDFLLFLFDQEDGGQSQDAPPDMDGAANGSVFVQMPQGLAPAHYIMVVGENGVADTAAFQILPLPDPVFSIWGTVEDEKGNPVAWVPVGANSDDDTVMPNFWYSFTDSSGQFVIHMDSSAYRAQQPWDVAPDRESLPEFIVLSRDTAITVTGDHGPIFFLVAEPAMFVTGTILDESGLPVRVPFSAWAWNEERQINRNGMVDSTGHYKIGFTEQDTGKWDIGVWSENLWNQYLEPPPRPVILQNPGDSLIADFRVYSVNDTIWGRLLLPDSSFRMGREIIAQSNVAGRGRDSTDVNGFFAIPVSSSESQYEVMLGWQDWNEFEQMGWEPNFISPLIAAPGDTIAVEFVRKNNQSGDVTVNGMNSGAQIEQGGILRWHYSLPPGGTAHVQFWVDRDQNRVFDPNADLMVAEFDQTDNAPGGNGPGDMDGDTNGEVMVEAPVGFAPAHYFLLVFEMNHMMSADFTVLPVANPVHKVFGQVLDPDGQGIPWVLVELNATDPNVQPEFWHAFTDGQGMFQFQLPQSVDGTSQPWQLTLSEFWLQDKHFNFRDTLFTITGDHGPIVFQQISLETVIAGRVVDQNGVPLPFSLEIQANQPPPAFNPKHVEVQPDGQFFLSFQEYEMGPWEIGVFGTEWNWKYLQPHRVHLDLMQPGDSLHLDFVVYSADTSIWGKLDGIDGSYFQSQRVFADNPVTGHMESPVDSAGTFRLPVSSAGTEYKINLDPQGYQSLVQAGFYLANPGAVMAMPGDSVVLYFSNAPVELGNLLVNGHEVGTKVHQGEFLEWQYQLPVGGSAYLQVWADTDGDSTLNSNSDMLLFQFSQSDNGFSPETPPDMDGIVNGRVYSRMPVGLAPAYYFFRLYDEVHADTAEFSVLPLINPRYSIFGTVVDEYGMGIPWILVQADTRDNGVQPNFWHAFTDSSGHYVIPMDSSAAAPGTEWRVSLNELTLSGKIPLESDYVLSVSGDHGPFDFHLVQPAMFIYGTIVDEEGNPQFDQLFPMAWNPATHVERHTLRVDSTGSFYLYFTAQDTGTWELGIHNMEMGKQFMSPPRKVLHLKTIGDTVKTGFTLFRTDAFIYGRIEAGGEPIVGNRRLFVDNDTTGSSEALSSPDGYFEIPVSSKAQNYQLHLDWNDFDQFHQAGFHPLFPDPLFVSPGDTVLIQFSRFISEVEEESHLPSDFSLGQSYPNPVSLEQNYSTTLQFAVPRQAWVQISVYNLLGQKIADLVNRMVQPGRHTVQWSGRNLRGEKVSAGIYFIRMRAPGFVQRAKLLIIR